MIDFIVEKEEFILSYTAFFFLTVSVFNTVEYNHIILWFYFTCRELSRPNILSKPLYKTALNPETIVFVAKTCIFNWINMYIVLYGLFTQWRVPLDC